MIVMVAKAGTTSVRSSNRICTIDLISQDSHHDEGGAVREFETLQRRDQGHEEQARKSRPVTGRRSCRCGRRPGCPWPTRCRRPRWKCRSGRRRCRRPRPRSSAVRCGGSCRLVQHITAAPTPTRVPSVSRKSMRNRVSRTGRKARRSTPTTSIFRKSGERLSSPCEGEGHDPLRRLAVTEQRARDCGRGDADQDRPRTFRCSRTAISTKPKSASSTRGSWKLPILRGTSGARSRPVGAVSAAGGSPAAPLVTIPVS